MSRRTSRAGRPGRPRSAGRGAMPAAERRALDTVLPARAGAPRRPGTDAADGRTLHEVAVLRVAPDGCGAASGRPGVNRKRVRRLMRVMGLEAIYQKPNTSKGHPDHKVYPYLLRGIDDRPAEPGLVRRHHLYPDGQGLRLSGRGYGLVQPPGSVLAPVDHHGGGFLRRGAAGGDRPAWSARDFQHRSGRAIHQRRFLDELESRGIRVSMDGKGRFLDNIFIERLWRSLKYEDVFIKAYDSVAEARQGIGGWLGFYNEERLHQALGYRTPRAGFRWRSPRACGQRLRFEGLRRCPQARGRTGGRRVKGIDPCKE